MFFIEKLIREKTYKKGSRSEITSNSLKKEKEIRSRSPLRFLKKCAGGSLISAQSLFPVDDASDQSSNAAAWEFLLAWFRRFLESEEDLRILLS